MIIIKTNKKILSAVLLILISSVLLSGCLRTKYRNNDKYTINIINSGYELVLYSNDGNELLRQTYSKEPNIVKVSDSIYKITNSTGVDSNYTFFVDTKNNKISKTYFNLLFSDTNKVAVFENDKIIVTDLFNNKKIYIEIERDFSKTAVPQSAILSVDMSDDKIFINYLRGNEYEEIYEELMLSAIMD